MGVLEILDNIYGRRLSFGTKESQAHVDELNKLLKPNDEIESLKAQLKKCQDEKV